MSLKHDFWTDHRAGGDRQIGRIMAALEELDQAGDTIVLFTTEHGEMLGDHGLLEKRAFYDGAVHADN